MMKRIFGYFLQGLLYIAPIAVTVYIIFSVFNVIDGTIQEYVYSFMDFKIPGLGIIGLFVFLTLLGFVGGTIIGKPISLLFNNLIDKAPIIKVIYSAFHDLFSAFAGKDKKFDKPVLVKINVDSDIYKLGFITESDLSKIDLAEHVGVYFPYAYSVLGEMIIVPKSLIKSIDIPAADVMKFVVSGGVAGWDNNVPADELK